MKQSLIVFVDDGAAPVLGMLLLLNSMMYKVEGVPQILDPSWMSPGELLLDIAAGLHGGQSFDHLYIGWARCQVRCFTAG